MRCLFVNRLRQIRFKNCNTLGVGDPQIVILAHGSGVDRDNRTRISYEAKVEEPFEPAPSLHIRPLAAARLCIGGLLVPSRGA